MHRIEDCGSLRHFLETQNVLGTGLVLSVNDVLHLPQYAITNDATLHGLIALGTSERRSKFILIVLKRL